MLLLAEYAYNNSAITATHCSPFFANYDFHPQTNWPVEKQSKYPASSNYAHRMEGVDKLCVKRLEETRKHMGKYCNRSRKEGPPYSVGDIFMLNGKNIRTGRAAKKLDAKLFGLFKVVRLV